MVNLLAFTGQSANNFFMNVNEISQEKKKEKENSPPRHASKRFAQEIEKNRPLTAVEIRKKESLDTFYRSHF